MHAVIGSNDSRYMRTVKASRCIVIWPCIILCKIPTTDYFVSRSISFAQRHMIKRNSTIDHCDGLALTSQTELRMNLIPPGLRMRFAQMLFDAGGYVGIERLGVDRIGSEFNGMRWIVCKRTAV